ncbi:MAG TPA: helix-turn-helix domain-containing protein [Polyangia bacterium]|nr:helix-turn-helix domain-containing protein [Polyangia bacterium]
MGLHEENKAERRGRIIAAARRLIAEVGYDGLNMRALADAAHVSVPTLYNLFGSKHAILAAEMQDAFRSVAGALDLKKRGDAVERAATLLQAGIKNLLSMPGYYRELVHVMLTSREPDELRRSIEDQYVALMAGNLRAGQADGELADWFDADVLSRQMFFTFMMVVLGWARGECDDDGLQQIAPYGQGMLLLGVARGETAARLAERVRRLQSRLNRR